ncbi:outer membrane beta-barrel protein [Silvimonas iriomotensis]|uniref:Porin OmpA n=1 Tax=Silvimonas iriomotensis TaxID=449662 RepID=A0ABQ2P6I6_9NEIS|nr:outer membrane beta-barrel protein [Silvimonas iriomotensis]GGP19438.1 porin OmpA [Silvimonas iriomotensis]
MKSKQIKLLAIASLLASVYAIGADNFSGFYIGGKAGANQMDFTGKIRPDTTESLTVGVEAGYNYVFSNNFVLGANIFGDYVDRKAATTMANYGNFGADIWGADLRLGYQIDNLMPYAKIGYAHYKGTDVISDFSDNTWHAGLGAEYKIAPNWGITGEWTVMHPEHDGTKIKSNSFMLGLNYHFGAKAAPAPVVATPTPRVEPVVASPEPIKATVVPPKPPMETRHFSLKSDVLFDFGKATLKPQGRDELNKLYEQVGNINVQDGQAIVVGYTDRMGSDKYNTQLGYDRARAVGNYLISRGAPADRIQIHSMGKARPVTGNTCDGIKNRDRLVACLAPDRRVEIDVQGTQTAAGQ